MYAIIKAGGKQYRVAVGDVVEIEKVVEQSGAEVTFSEVLMIASDEGYQVGRPVLEKASVTAEIVEQFRAPKVTIFKHKERKNYRKTTGHRQDLTRVRIKTISLS